MNCGILCAKNVDGVFGEAVKVGGKLAAKCRAVSPRGAWYGADGDAILLYERPNRAFQNYVEDLLRHEVLFLAPTRIIEEPLDFFRDVNGDSALITELRKGVARHGWEFSPFIESPNSAHLAETMGAKLHSGMEHEAVKRGLALDCNDKEIFTETCKMLGIRVPRTIYARGWDDLVAKVRTQRKRWGGMMLRIARAAGGLGNLKIERDDDLDIKLKEIVNAPGWKSATVLIGQLLELDHSPSTLAFIKADGSVEFIADSVQILKGGSAYVGSLIPSGLNPNIVALMRKWTLLYANHMSSLGARGYLNVDWILSGGHLYACESNFRYTAVVHPLKIRESLCNGTPRVARSHDALHVSGELTFTKALAKLSAEGLLFDARTKSGAVITIPPAQESMGYVVFGEDSASTTEMTTAIHRCLEEGHDSDQDDV